MLVHLRCSALSFLYKKNAAEQTRSVTFNSNIISVKSIIGEARIEREETRECSSFSPVRLEKRDLSDPAICFAKFGRGHGDRARKRRAAGSD